MSLLEVHDLHVAYGELEVVRGVSFSVEPGEIVTILGSNGAGKTTMLRSLGGLIRPTAGSVQFAGAIFAVCRPMKSPNVFHDERPGYFPCDIDYPL
jgi:branched-chain amino acid transport system ATP-binding protein